MVHDGELQLLEHFVAQRFRGSWCVREQSADELVLPCDVLDDLKSTFPHGP